MERNNSRKDKENTRQLSNVKKGEKNKVKENTSRERGLWIEGKRSEGKLVKISPRRP